MAVPKVNVKLLEDLEIMGFPHARATRALYYSGNTSLEEAITWMIDHENDTDIDEIPLVDVDIDIIDDSSQSFTITKEMRMKAHNLREQEGKRKRNEDKMMEREREKERIQEGKKLLEAKRIAEENERKRNLSLRKAEKEEEQRARENILKKLEQDKGENARIRRAFETLLVYVGNVVKNPNEEKYRKIRLSNPLFQDRVGSLNGGVEFLELCGFERMDDFLYLPSEKVDMELLSSAGSVLNSAITNPFFGLLSI
ncbi:uncharacterized protein [Cicer arietinum]|uniref:uncharacterized protein isoform X2 n=1 Tax=Cicer arietinum TaxID=3827 RepID=UPI003CC60901